jgi:hypothetical protein
VYSLARLRLPAISLINKIAKSIEKNYKDLEVKDSVLLFWSFGRIRSHSQRLLEVIKSRLDSHLVTVLNDENGIYYLEEPHALLDQLINNIIDQEYRQDSDIIESRQRMIKSYVMNDGKMASNDMQQKMQWKSEIEDY